MTQPIIKLALLAALAVVALFALRGSTRAFHRVLWRGYVVGILLAAGVSIVFPGALTWLAHKVGVGRGADLLLYILVVTFMLVSVILFRRISDLERKYVVLSRALALRESQEPDPRDPPEMGTTA
jgi:small membrane protein